MQKIYTAFLSLLIGSAAFAQSTGFMAPTSTATPNGWTNPANAYASDDQWATVAHQSGCRCPWVYLSWDGGTSYTAYHLMGPFGTTDGMQTSGSPTDNWGHVWTYTEFNNTNFRLKIANPSMSIEQGWSDFNFNVPSNATVTGVEVRLEWHGDANFTMEFLDKAEVNVYYTAPTGLQNISGKASISVFPNPAHDKLSFHFGVDMPEQISLLNLQGQVMLEKELPQTGSSDLEMDLSSLPRGIYFIRVISKGCILNEKIILE